MKTFTLNPKEAEFTFTGINGKIGVKTVNKKERQIIDFDSSELEVFGNYESGSNDTRDTPGNSASFHISDILFKGVSIYTLLGSCGDALERIEIQVLNKCYGHDYSL